MPSGGIGLLMRALVPADDIAQETASVQPRPIARGGAKCYPTALTMRQHETSPADLTPGRIADLRIDAITIRVFSAGAFDPFWNSAGATLQQAIGEAAIRRSQIEANPRRWMHRKVVERPFQLETSATHIFLGPAVYLNVGIRSDGLPGLRRLHTID